jgi:Phosphoadenosine phosphosulfate reductase family
MSDIITVLSYSGGKQSHALLEMVLRGDMPKPDNFLVLNADPGMENENSYPAVEKMRIRCADAGIPFRTAKTTLKHDLLTFKERGFKRLDNPPFWTKNRVTGKKGRLKQSCTQHYKIAAMRRELRKYLNEKFSVPIRSTRNLPKVITWIGFAHDEQARAAKAKSTVKFITLTFPLIEMGMSKAKIIGYYLKNNIQQPPASVCNACYANGLRFLEEMYSERPKDWKEAVLIDDNIRDMRQIGIEDECFVSSTLVPLRDMPARDFLRDKPSVYIEHECNSGVCFL